MRDAGSGGGGGGLGGPGIRIPGGLGAKGGIGGVLVVIVLFVVSQFLGVDLTGLGGGGSSAYSPARFQDTSGATDERYAGCETGEDANEDQDCARVAIENSLTDYWESELGDAFRPEEALVTFSGSVTTSCGGATSAVGPFYCPADETIYLDTTFFDDVLERQLGGPDGGFVEFYVLAHEYGHHISNITGDMQNASVTQDTGPTSPGTRLELQADCYAGLWTQHATQTEDASGEVLILDLTDEDISLAVQAARSVGDDYIQRKSGQRVDSDGWTHGSSDQREHWFRVGYEGGSFDDCDTFGASEAEVLGR